jgi:uncharacterized membrane protein
VEGRRKNERRRFDVNRSKAALPVVLAVVAMVAGYARFEPCLTDGWGTATEFSAVCYSDVAVLYETRPARFPAVPYRDYLFEYPVGTGAFVYATAALTAGLKAIGIPGKDTSVYFSLSALLLAACGVAAIWWTDRMPGRRRGDVAFLALGMAVMAYINWDLLTVALTAAALYAWSRDRPYLCGILLGWGAATKAYPALLLVPLFLVCVRQQRLRVFVGSTAAAALTWLALDAAYFFGPLRAGWTLFYTFSFHRDSDVGTVWHLLGHLLPGNWPGTHLDLAVSTALVVLTLAICALALVAPRVPSLGQLSFLMVAAFLLTTKSWSPQYGLWLLPLLVLTRLPWRVLYAWLAVDVAFYVGGMWYVNGQISGPGPELSLNQMLVVVGVHWIALAGLCALVTRDILRTDVQALAPGGGPAAQRPLTGQPQAVPEARSSRLTSPRLRGRQGQA